MDNKDKIRLTELSNNSGRASNEIIIESLKLLSKKELGNKRFWLTCSCSFVISLLIALKLSSITALEEIVGQINNVVLAIFSISFTAHSIYQALLSPKLIYAMVRADDKENDNISSFIASNNYFVSYMMLSFIVIIMNLIIYLVSILIPSNWNLLDNIFANNVLFILLIFPYFYCCICWVLEMKSVISNISNIYCLSATDKYIEELKNKDNK